MSNLTENITPKKREDQNYSSKFVKESGSCKSIKQNKLKVCYTE